MTGELKPLSGCRRKDKPTQCKADFRRSAWLTQSCHVLCPCTLSAFGMPQSGRKNAIGALHGPYNYEWLNMTHPALLAGLRWNSDVQLPYRLPILCATCRSKLPTQHLRKQALLAAQRARTLRRDMRVSTAAKTNRWLTKKFQNSSKGTNSCTRSLHMRTHENSVAGTCPAFCPTRTEKVLCADRSSAAICAQHIE